MPPQITLLINVLLAVAAGALVSGVDARTILVPEDVFPLYAAIDSAAVGDTVSVAPGTYSQRDSRTVFVEGSPRTVSAIAFLKAGVHVIGRDGAQSTVLDGGTDAPGFDNNVAFWNQPSLGEASLVGFSIVNSQASGSGLSCTEVGSLRVESCEFRENRNGGVAAVRAAEFSNLVLKDCVFVSNEGSSVAVMEKGDVRVESCLFEGNTGTALAIGADSHAVIMDSRFESNAGTPFAVLGSGSSTEVQVRHCEFIGNVEVGSGGGVQLDKCVANIEFCSFVRNSATSRGGGVIAEELSGPSFVQNCTFFECHADIEGSAIYAIFSELAIAHNVVVGSSGGPAVADFDGTSTGDCNLFWMNVGGDFDGWSGGPGDLFADPLFCDSASEDFSLQQESPAVTSPCGLVGAFGVGCGAVSIEAQTWSRTKALYR